jgi:hypothetical protein
MLEVLRSREVVSLIAAEHADDPRLDVQENLAVALAQDFDVALRASRKKEHVWSINWRIDNEWGAKGNGDPWDMRPGVCS